MSTIWPAWEALIPPASAKVVRLSDEFGDPWFFGREARVVAWTLRHGCGGNDPMYRLDVEGRSDAFWPEELEWIGTQPRVAQWEAVLGAVLDVVCSLPEGQSWTTFGIEHHADLEDIGPARVREALTELHDLGLVESTDHGHTRGWRLRHPDRAGSGPNEKPAGLEAGEVPRGESPSGDAENLTAALEPREAPAVTSASPGRKRRSKKKKTPPRR